MCSIWALLRTPGETSMRISNGNITIVYESQMEKIIAKTVSHVLTRLDEVG